MDSQIELPCILGQNHNTSLYGSHLKRDSESTYNQGGGFMLSTLWFVLITIVTKSIIWSIVKYFQWHNNSNSKHYWNSITAKKCA